MYKDMAGLHNSNNSTIFGRAVTGFFRFGLVRGLRSVEIDPEDFRKELANKHGLWVPHFGRMRNVPAERLDAIAKVLIRDAERLALAEGAGLGLGGMITLLPDAGFLTIITLRLVQRLSLLYGFDTNAQSERLEMWKAAAAAAGVDYGREFAERQLIEKVVPRIAERLAMKIGEESAAKWVGRIIPLASSAIGGGLNFFFVRAWGRRVQKHLRARHTAMRPPVSPAPSSAYTAPQPVLA
jgi:EcsC protein family